MTVRLRNWGLTAVAVRLYEIAIIALGVYFDFVAEPDDTLVELRLLSLWNLLVVGYIAGGALLARRMSQREDGGPLTVTDVRPRWLRRVLEFHQRSGLFTFTASITGVTAALTIATSAEYGEYRTAVRALGVVTILCAWLLLHGAYARVYATAYRKSGDRGLDFPGTERPGIVEFVYFAFMMGTTFATPDVRITTRHMRWIATVHGVIAFFYYVALLSFAVSLLPR